MQKGKISELIGALLVGSGGSFVGVVVGSLLGTGRTFAELGGYEFTGLFGMLLGMGLGASLCIYFIRKQRKQEVCVKKLLFGAFVGLLSSLILFNLFTTALHFYNFAFVLLAVMYLSVVGASCKCGKK